MHDNMQSVIISTECIHLKLVTTTHTVTENTSKREEVF